MIKKLLVGAMASVSMVACGSVSSTGDVDVKAEAVIIDVRSPSEFAEGHVDGAINLDLEGGVFEAEYSKLDPSKSYIVYCRSGRRSGVAASILKDNGFVDIVNLQTLENSASKTGLSIVNG